MNPLQKAWLIVLRPVVSLVNDKLAKKSGILGRIGKFYAFGPRQFGFHPINRIIAHFNHCYVSFLGFTLHRYSLIKSFTQNGFYFSRPFGVHSLLGPIMAFYSLLMMAIPYEIDEDEQGTTLNHLSKTGKPVPINALNFRQSAHYTEINEMYMYEMMKKFQMKKQQLVRQRNGLNDQKKKTKYARPGYVYIEPHTRA